MQPCILFVVINETKTFRTLIMLTAVGRGNLKTKTLLYL